MRQSASSSHCFVGTLLASSWMATVSYASPLVSTSSITFASCKRDKMMTHSNTLGFATRCVHAGQDNDPTTGAVITPIYATSTYAQSSPGVHKGFEYARTQNPTRMALERCIADLEGGIAGFAFASGMAATATILDCLEKESHVVVGDDVYGGTRRLFDQVRRPSAGIEATYVD